MTAKEENAKIIEYTLSKARERSKAWEMLIVARNNLGHWDDSKIGRWIGYAQCLLVAEGATTIDELRDEIRRIVNAS
jgi:hypothetical protein